MLADWYKAIDAGNWKLAELYEQWLIRTGQIARIK